MVTTDWLWRGMISCTVGLLVACDADPSARPQPQGQDPELDALTTAVEQALDSGSVPGASFALIRDGAVLAARGVGIADADSGAPVEPNTMFEAASLSKPVFAYLVLGMVERGELDLDRPLAEILPHPDLDDPRASRITARHVLTHSSGLPNWRPRAWSDAPGALVMQFEPGERFSYSGEGFEYLRRVVEQMTGSPLDELARREVFDPLGMTASTFHFDGSFETAQPHDVLGRKGRKRDHEPNAAGSLHTTAGDYARFVREILQPTRASQATIDAMLTPRIQVEDGVSWGLGWGLEPDGTFWHWGDNGDFRCFVMASREDRTGMVLFTNGNNGLAIAESLFERALGAGHPSFSWIGYERADEPAFQVRQQLLRAGMDGPERFRAALAEVEAGNGREALEERFVNRLGYALLRREAVDAALEMFRWNAATYPDSWNVHDSLGEALAESGATAEAIASFERSIELNPDNQNGHDAIERLRGR